MPRVLLLLPTTTYRSEAFIAAATRLEVDVTVASERRNTLTHLNPSGLLTLDFKHPERAVKKVVDFSKRYPIDAVVPVDSEVTVVGSLMAKALGIRHNSPESAIAASDKHHMRNLLQRGGVPCPDFQWVPFDSDREAWARQLHYPSVVKPTSLSGSQGVIRVDSPEAFIDAAMRVERILKEVHASAERCDISQDGFLVEDFVEGPEIALEGMLCHGRLSVLAIFDKPDPLDGPYFEETLYITPSRHSVSIQEVMSGCVSQGAQALGLTEGPIHAELRWSDQGPSLIEINPRSIGGLCSRTLRFGTGISLESLILKHALHEEFVAPDCEARASGVMMIPIPRTGIYQEVLGVSEAESVPGIEQLIISAHPGQHLTCLPEGAQYLGFLFARGEHPEEVERALRESFACLDFSITTESVCDRQSDQ